MKFSLTIKSNVQFRYILKNGEFEKGKCLVVHIMKNLHNKNNNFFGVCVSKKNGNSVMRNKMKRWAREIYKDEEIFLKKGYQIIIIYKKSTLFKYLTYKKVRADIIECFKKLEIYEKNNT